MLKSGLICAVVMGMVSCLAARSDAGAVSSAMVTFSGAPAGGGSDGPHIGVGQSQSIFNDGSNSAQAQVDMLTLDTSAALDLAPGQFDGHAQAVASYEDTFTITASSSGTADFVFAVDGSLTPNSDYSLDGYLNSALLPTSMQWTSPGSVFDEIGFSVPFTSGAGFDLKVAATSNAYETDGTAGPSSSSNFFGTAQLVEIVISGASNAQITSDIPCSYQGFVVPAAPLPAGAGEGAALFAIVIGGSLVGRHGRLPRWLTV